MSGRAADNRLVHFAPGAAAPRPGDVVTTVVTRGAPTYLLADGEPLSVRRTRGGDAWQARRAATEPTPAGSTDSADSAPPDRVLLGMPGPRPAPDRRRPRA
jgi:tRNA-2-methylthio-N6-dimethylallyladenosine synthase